MAYSNKKQISSFSLLKTADGMFTKDILQVVSFSKDNSKQAPVRLQGKLREMSLQLGVSNEVKMKSRV